MGVHTVIDLRISPHQVRQEKSTAEKMGFTWINLPMGAEPPTRRQVTRFLATLQRAPAEPVFVHCQHGSDRTGCMIGIWRIRQQGWTFAEACKEMRHYGFNPHWKKLTEAVQKAGRQSERVTSR
jgi:protein tyrosine/serine phosphatase